MKGSIFQIFTVCMMILLSSCNPKGTVNSLNTPISIFTKSITIDSVTAANGTATIAWSGSTDAQSYIVKYGTAAEVYTTTVSTNATSPLTITGLTNGNSYFILVTEVQKTGKTVDATPIGVTPIDPFTITSVTASNQQATLVFPTVVGASAYTVKYGTSNGIYTNVVSKTATSPYVVTGLTNGVTYYFMVAATNSNNGSQEANAALAAIPTAPTTLPSGVIASSTASGQIVINWNAATAATSYNVKRSTFSGGGYSAVGSLVAGTTFTDTTVANGTRYFYVVTSNSAGGESAISNEANSMSIASFTTLAAAVTTSGQVSLSWTGPNGATVYDVKYRITGTTNYSTFANNITSSSSSVTSLSPGTPYDFLVTAKNAYSGTLNSNMVSATTLASATLAISALSESAKIDWTAVFGSTSYDIMYGDVSGTYTTTLVNQNQATGVTIAGLSYTAPGPIYYVKVRSYTAAGYVDSAEYSVTVLPPVPAAPVVTTAVSNVVNMSWPVGGNLGTLRYSVLRDGVALAACTTIVARSCIDTTAVAGTTYTYTVTATNEGGTSPASSNIVAKPIASFNITNVVLDQTTANQAIVTWPSPTGADAAVYVVKYGTVSGTYTTTVLTCNSSPCTVTGLPAQTVYFMVTATNTPVGVGAVSAEKNATSGFAAVPIGAPTIASLTPGINSLTTEWSTVAEATSYDILYSSSVDAYAATYTIYNVTSPYVLTGLGYGTDQAPTQYSIQVRANNLNGGVLSTPSSSPVNFPTFMRPGYLPAEGGINKITIKWGASIGQGAITYTVKRSTTVEGTYSDVAGCVALSAVTSCIDNTATAGTTFFYVIYANESLIAAPFTQTNTSAYSSQIVFAQSIAQPTIAIPEIRGEASALYVTYPSVAGGQTYSLAGGAGTATPAGTQSTGSTIHYTGLTGGTTYNFVLTVTNTITATITVNGVPTIRTNTTTATSAAQPGIPLGDFTWPAATATTPLNPLTGTTANLIWNASAGASNYDIVYSSASHAGTIAYAGASPYAGVVNTPYSPLSPASTSVTSPTTITATGTPDAGGVYYIRAIAKNTYGYLFSVDELTTGVWTFTGISSIDNVTTSSMRINWTAHPQASYYKIYMEQLAPTAVARILLPSSTTQASNSYTVLGLTSGAQYKFSVYAVDANGMVDANTNTLVQTAFRASAPTGIALQNPNLLVSSATANTGLEDKPTFRVSGVTATHIIKLYEDSACTTTVVGSATAAGVTVDITITTALANPGTARPYVHTYYATAEPPSDGNGPTGAVSTCSTVTGTYNYYPCLTGYAPVPGNATLGTNPFCVMQSEARNVAGVATSTATGSPWTGVTATEAKTYCNQISTTTARNYDLISNPEWMAIARNMEAVAANWNGGVVNTNSMWAGNFAGIGTSCSYADRILPVVDGAHGAPATVITTDPYDQVCGNASWNAQTRRTLQLANGYTIWDMAGNAGEITEWATNRSPVNTIAAFSNAPTGWTGWCPVGWEAYNAIGSMSTCAQLFNGSLAILPSTPAGSQNKRHGLFYGGNTGVAVRGGSYLNADYYTGIYTLDFSITPSAATPSIGFRCVDRP